MCAFRATLSGAWAAALLLIGLAQADAGVAEGTPEPVLIAVAGPLSGPYASDGEEIRRAAEAAVATLNEAGGLRGARLTLEVVDDGCDAARAAAVAEHIAALRPALVAGHSCSNAAIAAARVYAKSGIPMISSGARHPDLTTRRAGSGIFRLAGRDDAQGTVAAVYMHRETRGERLAIVHDRTAAARRLAEASLAALTAAGAPPPLVLTIVAGEKDYAKIAARLAQSRVAAVFFAGFPIEAGILLRQLRAMGSPALFLAPDMSATPELTETAGHAAEGVRVLLPYERTPTSRAGAGPGTDTPARSALWLRTFAAIEAWAEAARRAGSSAEAGVLAVLNSETFETALGPVSFDANGDVRLPSYEPWVWRDGAWTRAQ